MALSKSDQSIPSTSVPAGTLASAPVTTAAKTVGYGALVVLRIANGGSGPAVGAQVSLQVSADGVNWFTLAGPFQAGITANDVYDFAVLVTVDAIQIRAAAWGNTGQAVSLLVMNSRTDTL